MKRFAMAIAVVCILCIPALAGDIPCDYIPPPPGMVADSPGDIPSVTADIPFDLTQQVENAAYESLVAVVGWLV